jgi:BMFP domain-containing protein YqiC
MQAILKELKDKANKAYMDMAINHPDMVARESFNELYEAISKAHQELEKSS